MSACKHGYANRCYECCAQKLVETRVALLLVEKELEVLKLEYKAIVRDLGDVVTMNSWNTHERIAMKENIWQSHGLKWRGKNWEIDDGL